MIIIGFILIVLVFCILCGIVSIDNTLKVLIQNQFEIIRALKNK